MCTFFLLRKLIVCKDGCKKLVKNLDQLISEASEFNPKHVSANNILREIGVKHLVEYFDRYRESIGFAESY